MSSSIFDMLGPVMVGPSSSHTAGVVRIGRVAYKILKKVPKYAKIYFYNSFAHTFQGHGSDRAIIAGLMNFKTNDKRIKNALELAKKQNLKYEFIPVINNKFHPNTIKLELKTDNETLEIIGVSRGGGLIKIIQLNGFQTYFTAQLHTLILFADDIKGSIAFITNVIAHDNINIATMTVDRKRRNDIALLVLEMDNSPKKITLEYISELNWIHKLIYIPDIDL